MDVCPETGSGQRSGPRYPRSWDRGKVPSWDGASAAVSRVSKLPTWTRDRAAIPLAGSTGTGTTVSMCQVPMSVGQWTWLHGHVGGRGLRPCGPPIGHTGTGTWSCCATCSYLEPRDMMYLFIPGTKRSSAWDRGDLCPWYTDCQQLRDETRADTMYQAVYSIPVVLYTILY